MCEAIYEMIYKSLNCAEKNTARKNAAAKETKVIYSTERFSLN